ncbi:MAG: Hsp20/alpha crystallin family protein [Anaerolineae bacterium]|nr:Hsp20/alpha crystallin family protein [Anaerolineae bacterium]
MSSLVRWDPFRELVDDMWGQPRSVRPFDIRCTGLDLGMDVYETDKDLVAQVAIPGIDPDDIEITITGDMLTIRGEIAEEEEENSRKYLWREMARGEFIRSVSLPAGLQTDKAQAEFRNGVLILTIPKREEAKAKRIRVKAH